MFLCCCWLLVPVLGLSRHRRDRASQAVSNASAARTEEVSWTSEAGPPDTGPAWPDAGGPAPPGAENAETKVLEWCLMPQGGPVIVVSSVQLGGERDNRTGHPREQRGAQSGTSPQGPLALIDRRTCAG